MTWFKLQSIYLLLLRVFPLGGVNLSIAIKYQHKPYWYTVIIHLFFLQNTQFGGKSQQTNAMPDAEITWNFWNSFCLIMYPHNFMMCFASVVSCLFVYL